MCADYVKTVNFEAKDSLPTGDPDKVAVGKEVDDEFDAIAVAIATKMDKSGGIFTGPITVSGSITVEGGSPLVLEGATNNAFETTIVVVDPTQDNTITIPDSTISILGDPMTSRGDIIVRDSSNLSARLGVGAANTFLGSDATDVAHRVISLADLPNGSKLELQTEQATTSGTEKDFTIPSWVKKITMTIEGLSTNATSIIIVQLGDAGGIETSGYLGSVDQLGSAFQYNTGFAIVNAVGAAEVRNGTVTITLKNAAAFTWAADVAIGRSDAASGSTGAGVKSLSAALTTVRLTMVNGSDTFDAGSVNLLLE